MIREAEARAVAPAAPMTQRLPVVVERVSTRRELRQFLELPARLYAGDPCFVQPLLAERRDFLDPARNPFFRHATVELFLARRAGSVVGRIAAVEDRSYNSFHSSRTGHFGLYEAEDDPAVVTGLFAAATRFLRSRGLTSVLGPMSLSTNHECGLLVDGFDRPPVAMMTYNPPSYVRHFEEVLELKKAKDLLAFQLDVAAEPPERVVRIAEKIRAKEGVRVRPLDLSDFPAECRRLKEIYNSAWERNWGFVPLSDEEFDHMARELRTVAVPELVRIAEVGGSPVAFAMGLPDSNQALGKLQGKLTTFGLPLGLAKLFWHSRRTDGLRLVTLGVKEAYRKRGLDAILYLDTGRAARKLGYKSWEISWTLEDNVLVNRAIEMMGGKQYKTYRLYEANL